MKRLYLADHIVTTLRSRHYYLKTYHVCFSRFLDLAEQIAVASVKCFWDLELIATVLETQHQLHTLSEQAKGTTYMYAYFHHFLFLLSIIL